MCVCTFADSIANVKGFVLSSADELVLICKLGTKLKITYQCTNYTYIDHIHFNHLTIKNLLYNKTTDVKRLAYLHQSILHVNWVLHDIV